MASSRQSKVTPFIAPGATVTNIHDPSLFCPRFSPLIFVLDSLLSQFMQTPRDTHLDCAKRVLRYVSGTMDCGILYKTAMPIRLEGYTDADWAGYKADRRSTSGFVFSLGNGAISWSSKKQPTIALSSIEAEYKGAAVAACESVFVKISDHE